MLRGKRTASRGHRHPGCRMSQPAGGSTAAPCTRSTRTTPARCCWEILEPPLAGAVASGAFTLVGERLTLRLSRLEYRGRSFVVDAWPPASTAPATASAARSTATVRARAAAGVRALRRRVPDRALAAARDGDRGRRSALRAPRRLDPRGGPCRSGHGGAGPPATCCWRTRRTGPSVRIPRDTELVVVFAAPPICWEGDDSDD